MQKVRIIPRLDIKSPNVIKGVRMIGFRRVGEPAALAKKYEEQGADELLIVDIVASLYQRDPDVETVRSVARELSVPLTVAGGIRSLRDIENLLREGADKVGINTHAVHVPHFLKEASDRFGSQCIVLCIDAKHRYEDTYEVYTDGGREPSGLDVRTWIQEAQSLGIGEILLTAIDRDGTKKGFDMRLLHLVSDIATVPVIFCGGASSAESVQEAALAGANAVAVASILHNDTCTVGMLKDALL